MVTLEQFTKANKKRKAELAKRAGFTDVEKFRAHLKGVRVAKTINELTKEKIPTIHIVNIVDCSGSMGGSKIDAANEMVKSDINKVLNETDVYYTYTLRTFSTRVDEYKNKLDRNPKYTLLTTHSMTALYDAIGDTLEDLKSSIPTNEKVIVSIITDGEENSSVRYSAKDVSKLIEDLNSKNFTITFVGTNQDVEKAINKLKIDRSNTQSYDGTGVGLKKSMLVREKALATYSKSVVKGEDVKTGFYKKVLNK